MQNASKNLFKNNHRFNSTSWLPVFSMNIFLKSGKCSYFFRKQKKTNDTYLRVWREFWEMRQIIRKMLWEPESRSCLDNGAGCSGCVVLTCWPGTKQTQKELSQKRLELTGLMQTSLFHEQRTTETVMLHTPGVSEVYRHRAGCQLEALYCDLGGRDRLFEVECGAAASAMRFVRSNLTNYMTFYNSQEKPFLVIPTLISAFFASLWVLFPTTPQDNHHELLNNGHRLEFFYLKEEKKVKFNMKNTSPQFSAKDPGRIDLSFTTHASQARFQQYAFDLL